MKPGNIQISPNPRPSFPVRPRPTLEIARRQPFVIGLAGRMGSGKDTVAALLRMRGYDRRAFADALRQEVRDAVGAREAPSALPIGLVAKIRAGVLTSAMVDQKPMLDDMRRLLQFWGTEYRRSQDPEYWIQRLAESLTTGRYYAISDVRFANEAEFVRRMGGKVWMITGRRGDGGIKGHSSERLDFDADATIDNSGTIYDLAVAVTREIAKARQCNS